MFAPGVANIEGNNNSLPMIAGEQNCIAALPSETKYNTAFKYYGHVLW